jgi:hypothetical protein
VDSPDFGNARAVLCNAFIASLLLFTIYQQLVSNFDHKAGKIRAVTGCLMS